MARQKPDDDRRIADLSRYRKAREEAARKAKPAPKRRSEALLGPNPRAAMILVIVVLVMLALYVLPRFL